jgi:hypothetical protein
MGRYFHSVYDRGSGEEVNGRLCLRIMLHHVRACKHLAGFFIPPAAGELGVDHGVLDRGVTYPVLHEAEIRASVEEMGGDRVFEHVEMALVLGDPRQLAVGSLRTGCEF